MAKAGVTVSSWPTIWEFKDRYVLGYEGDIKFHFFKDQLNIKDTVTSHSVRKKDLTYLQESKKIEKILKKLKNE